MILHYAIESGKEVGIRADRRGRLKGCRWWQQSVEFYSVLIFGPRLISVQR